MKKSLKIEFNSVKFDAIICLNGDMPELEVFYNLSDLPLIAADGAANNLFKNNLNPNYIIGDIDSIESELLKLNFNNIQLFHLSDQDINDFEKCLMFAKIKGWENLLIFGFSGGLLEHTLNNWSVFKRFSKLMNLCIYDKDRYGFSISKSVEVSTKINEIISLIPEPSVKLTTKNLNWNLDKEILSLGIKEGARNISLGESIELTIFSGQLLIFCDARLPYIPNYIIS